MTSTIKQAIRSVKETVLQYSEIEIKVRNATNNDKWGVSSSAMSEIARATSDYQEYPQLFAMLWKRLNDVEHVMHVYKALILVEYLLRNGAERFINDAKRRSRDIAQLTKYKHYDENNRDDAVEARNKAKQVYQLLTDEQRLKEERQKALKIRDVKMSGFGSNDNGYSIGGGDENNDYRADENRNSIGNYDQEENNSEAKAQENTEKPKKKKTPKHDSNGQAEIESSGQNGENGEKKKKKKKKKPAEGNPDNGIQETQSNTNINTENVFGFDAARDPFGSNDDPFAAAGFSQKPINSSVSASDYPGGPTPVPVSIPNRLPTVSQTVQQQNAMENPSTEKKKKKKKDKESSPAAAAAPVSNNGNNNKNVGSASAAYAAQVQSDPFSSASDPFNSSGVVNYDLSSFGGPTYVGDKNIDILTGLHATAHQSGDLADVFAAASLTDNNDPFTTNFNKSNNSISNNPSHNPSNNNLSQPPKRDVWDLATEIANIDNIHAAPVQKKAEKKEEISMSMMRSMQPLGVSHDMLQQQEQRQVPKSNIMPTPQPSLTGYNLPLMPNPNIPQQQLYMQSTAGPLYAQPQPMLMLMAPGAAQVAPPNPYAGQIPMYAPQQQQAVPVDPFSTSISPTGGFGRRAPGAAYNSKGPIIFEAVPERRNDTLQTSLQPQPIVNTAPAGPNWNRY